MNKSEKSKEIAKITRKMIMKEETRRLYIVAAIEVFRDKGFNETHVKDITNRAGTSVGSFYNYFKDGKEEIIEEIFKEIARIFTQLIANLQQYELPTYKNFHDMFRNYLNIVKDRSNLILFFIEQMGGINQRFLHLKNDLINEAAREAEKLLNKLLENKFIPKQDTKLSAFIWINTLLTTYQWWARNDFEGEQDEIISNMTNFLIWGTTGKYIKVNIKKESEKKE
ncbi:MAG: TetR/AcrR family transcriptional regulator [Promethearchaeota archaeon]|nr:MAG: TetR/AcrR family transcriptional regulator [Candidatus Lokiarchaeota archaeon]